MPIYIFAAWLVAAMGLLGLGRLILGCTGSLTQSFWAGIVGAILFLQGWNLFLPVNGWASLVLLLLGISGLCIFGLPVIASFKNYRASIVLCLVAALVASIRCTAPCVDYDTGLYGATAVKWISTYPAAPGLANLHGRLGFNCSAFLLIAALGQGFWLKIGFRLCSGLFVTAGLMTCLGNSIFVIGAAPARGSDRMATILLAPFTLWLVIGDLVGDNTDFPAISAALIGALFLAKSLENRNSTDGVLTALLLCAAITMKLSAIVFAAGGLGIAVVLLLRSRQRRAIATVALVMTLLLSGWVCRGVVLSGFPLYPETIGGVPVSWRVPDKTARDDATAIREWARIPNENASARIEGWNWLGEWWRRMLKDRVGFDLPLLVIVVGGIIVIAGRRMDVTLWLLLPGVAGIAFWLYEAPDMRFGAAAIWSVAATLGGAAIRVREDRTAISRAALSAVAAIFLGFAALRYGRSIRSLASAKSMEPLRAVPLDARASDFGVVEYVPTDKNSDQCWDAPLTATPFFNARLRFRRVGDLGAGFEQ